MLGKSYPVINYDYYARLAERHRAGRTRRMWERIGAVFVLLGLAVAVGAWSGYQSALADPELQAVEHSVTTPDCAAARAAGAAPVSQGQPG